MAMFGLGWFELIFLGILLIGGLVSAVIIMLLVARGSGRSRVAELEEENHRLREQLDELQRRAGPSKQ